MLGDYAGQQAAQLRLLALAIAAATRDVLPAAGSLRSWRLALLVFLTLPAALVGGLLAALLTGGVISLGSLAGLLAGVWDRGAQPDHADQALSAIWQDDEGETLWCQSWSCAERVNGWRRS